MNFYFSFRIGSPLFHFIPSDCRLYCPKFVYISDFASFGKGERAEFLEHVQKTYEKIQRNLGCFCLGRGSLQNAV